MARVAGNGDFGSRCGEIPMHVAQRDRSEDGRRSRARDEPDVTAARRQLRSGRRDIAVDAQRHQLARHAAAATVQYADHDLLSDVATLRERDRRRRCE